MNIKTLGKRIKEKRIKANISQNLLAEKSGVCRLSITRLEGGKHIPRFDKMIKLLQVIDMPISQAI